MSGRNPYSIQALWSEIALVAKLILLGLVVISLVVVQAFVALVLEPGPLQPGENLFVHIALLILVPMATLGMIMLVFGYAWYQIRKREANH